MSSGFSYPQPIFKSPIYNPAFYLTLDASGYLTYEYAQTLYLSRTDYRLTYISGITPGIATQGVALVVGNDYGLSGIGALSCSSLTVGGAAITSSPAYITDITPGTAQASKALVLDSGKAITGITSLTVTTLTGTLQTAAQTNITSLGTLSSLTVSTGISVLNGSSPLSLNNTTSSSTFNISIQNSGGAQDIGSTTAHQVALRTSGVRRLVITSVGNITIPDTASGLQLDLGNTGTGLNVPNLTFRGTTFNDAFYTGITTGGGVASKAVVLNSTLDYSGMRNLTCSGIITASTSLSSPTLTCDTISKPGTQIMTASTLNINPTTLQLRGTTITASATELNYLSTISPGTVGNSKVMVVDSLGSIAGLNSLNCVSVSTSGNITAGGVINGFLGYANQAAITTLGPLTELGINSTAISEYIRVQASGLDYLDGSYTRMVRFLGSNLTPVEFQIEVNNGARATTTNATWIGTRTTNDFRLGSNDSTVMIITTAGRVGVGTTTPSYQFQVSGSVSSTIDAAGSGVAYFLRSGGLVSTIGPLSSISVGIGTSGAVLASSGFYTTSDARIKKDFTELPGSVADGMLSVRPLLFRYKNQSKSTPLQLGYRAQDLLKAKLPHCVNFIDVEDLPVEDTDLDTHNIQYSVDYSKVVCLLHQLVLRQQAQIDALKNRLTIIEQ